MIQKLAVSISVFLYHNNVIKEEEKEICRYGDEITISSMIGFFVIIAVGALFHQTGVAIIYLMLIVPLRMYTGGYHAKTYLKCNIIFGFIFAMVLFTYKIFTHWRFQAPISILSLFSLVLIWKYGPVENKNKPLLENERHRYLKISLAIGGLYYCSSLLLTMIGSDYGLLISLVIDTVAILMIEGEKIEQISEDDSKTDCGI